MSVARFRPVRSLPARGTWRLNSALCAFGEKHRLDWLTYNPIQMHSYHLLARAAAPAAVAAMVDTFPHAHRYVDVGAGSGAIAAETVRLGKQVIACERSRVGRLYARLQGVQRRPFDLAQPVPAVLQGPFDLAYCFEVAEHLPPTLGDALVRFLAKLSPTILFSAAQPGQGGLSHINEQPPQYWMLRFSDVGYQYDPSLTGTFRSAVRRHGGTELWLLTNTMVFSPS